nr:DNA-directed DNA polymerase [Tanacetum cinerariifolium]
MSTRSSARNLFPPLDNLELTIRRRPRVDPTLLTDFEMVTDRNGDNIPPVEGGDLPVSDLRTMEELYQPTLNGRGGPIASIAIQATNFGLKNDMIQQVYNSCQFHGLPGFNQNQNQSNPNQNYQNQNRNQENNHGIPQGNNQERNQFFQGASHGQNPPPAYQASAYQAPGYQDPVHQAPIPQPQVVTTTEFINYMKANDAILKNMQTNMTSLTNSNLKLKNMFGQFMKMNTASSSGSGTLPSNIVTNPKEDLKGITTQSGIAYQGPTIPTTSSSPKIVERETEETKDTVPPANNGSTKDVQPPVFQIENQILNYEPVVEPVEAPVSAPKPNPKPSIPYPSRLHDQKLRDKVNDQKEKFSQIFQDLNFNISFADALILMPKFGPTIKCLLTNKDKVFELARTPLNEHCSTVLLKKLPEKLGDPDKFLIPCDFSRMDECLALADLDANINLMPLSVWNKLSLPELSPTCMTLELMDRLISRPVGVIEDVFVKVGTFHFPADFVVVNFDVDPRVSLILEVLGFSVSGNPTPSTEPIVSTSSPTLTLFGDSDFLLEETNAFLAIDDEPISPKIEDSYYDSGGYILLLEEFLNDDPSSPALPPQELKGDDKLPIIIAKDLKDEEKTALIKVLKSHKQALAWQLSNIKGIDPEFCTDKILIEDDFKPAVQHQRRVNPKIHEVIKKEVLKLLDAGLIYPISDSSWVSPVHYVPKKGSFTVVENEENELIPTRLVTVWRTPKIKKRPHSRVLTERLPTVTMEVFMDDFSVFGNSFGTCLSHLDKMLKRCEDTNLCLNWEKSHFMVKEGIVLGHKISKNGIEVDKAKVDVIAKLPHPTTIKGICSFLGHTGFHRRFIQDFLKIARPMTRLLEKDTSFFFSKECIEAFQTLKKKLTEAPILVAPNWDLPFELMCDASDFAIGAENLAADHLSRLENPHQSVLNKKDINETFPFETLNMVSFRGDSSTSWFGTPRAIISDRGTHFYKGQLAKVMFKYGVTHHLATAYHPQTSGQVQVSNCGLKRILKRTIGENRASWSDKLDDALWAFRTAFKTPIGLIKSWWTHLVRNILITVLNEISNGCGLKLLDVIVKNWKIISSSIRIDLGGFLSSQIRASPSNEKGNSN